MSLDERDYAQADATALAAAIAQGRVDARMTWPGIAPGFLS
jgi:hypothetical protein